VPPPAATPILADLVAERLLDADLAALAWLLMERGVPVLVAGSDGHAAVALLDALVAALPGDRQPGAAVGAGAIAGRGAAAGPGAPEGRVVRVPVALPPDGAAGALRTALATTTGRSGLAALVAADDLPGVLGVLAHQGLNEDEASFLGVVLVAERRPETGGESRVTAAHYLRPVVRDAAGHPRRQRPAVLATWLPDGDRWEDFAWGIAPDLAERCRMRAGDFEAELARRAAALAGPAAPVLGPTRAPAGPTEGEPVG
jgi:hypothetical protein